MTTPDPAQTLYLIDGTAQLFRAFFAVRGLTTTGGMPTGAIYGFTTMLRKLLQERQPRRLAVAFDRGGHTFRHEQFPEYKANREATPDELNVQAPYAKRVCQALNVPVLELDDYEADDLIATFTRHGREAGFEVVIVASDKDLLQLVRDGVRVFHPSKEEFLDAAAVEESFGVPPERVLDVQGLMGDSVDNIPGVPGVGEKTAKGIVATYGELEAILERAARFVTAFSARDALLESIGSLAGKSPLDAGAAEQLASAASGFGDALGALVAVERDDELSARYSALAAELQALPGEALRPAAGTPGREAARPLRELKKTLKGLERGSARRVWTSIHEHADRARLSRRLATLCDEAPLPFDPVALTLGPPNRAAARELFGSLGFRGLTNEFSGPGADTEGGGDASTGDSAVPEPVGGRPVLDEAALKDAVRSARQAGRIALHAEAQGYPPLRAALVGVALAWGEGDEAAVYVPLAHDYLGAPAQLPAETVRSELAPLLADPGVAKVGLHVKETGHVLRRAGLSVEGWELDVAVGAFLLNAGRSHYDRTVLAGELLGREAVSREQLTGSGTRRRALGQVELGPMTAYAAAGAALTLELSRVVAERLASASLLDLYRTMDGPLLPVLERMERRGIRVDTELLSALSREFEASLDAARVAIHELAGTEFNIDSPKQLREVLFERLGLRPRRKTAKSKVASTDAQTLDELAEEHEIARRILEYRELAKLKGTYVDALPRLVHPETGRVHTRFHPTGAATGRLSSSDPNLQNIPARTETGRRIRTAFVPEPGHRFLAADYSQIELRVLAHLCGDTELQRAFRDGEDIHRHTAAVVGGVLPGLVTDEMRRRAKAVNFGVLYGMSELRLAREQGMTRTEARAFIREYFERFPAVRGYVEGVRAQALEEGAVRTLFGRVRSFPQLHQRVNRTVREQALRAAVNTTIQGTAADLMKLAMLRVDEALRAAGAEARILLQVHDELLLEVPETELVPVSRLVREAMEQVHRLAVPLVVDQKTGADWAAVT